MGTLLMSGVLLSGALWWLLVLLGSVGLVLSVRAARRFSGALVTFGLAGLLADIYYFYICNWFC